MLWAIAVKSIYAYLCESVVLRETDVDKSVKLERVNMKKSSFNLMTTRRTTATKTNKCKQIIITNYNMQYCGEKQMCKSQFHILILINDKGIMGKAMSS